MAVSSLATGSMYTGNVNQAKLSYMILLIDHKSTSTCKHCMSIINYVICSKDLMKVIAYHSNVSLIGSSKVI